MAARDAHRKMVELLEAVFSVRSVRRLHNGMQLRLRYNLEKAVRTVEVCCEMAGSLGVSQLGQRVSWETVAGQ
jgi:hypothetical protein